MRASVSSIRGRGYRSLRVREFSTRKSIHNRRDPFGFLTKRMGAAKGAWDGSMNPLSRLSVMYCFIASSSSADILYSGENLSAFSPSPSSSILWSYERWGGRISLSAFEKTCVHSAYSGEIAGSASSSCIATANWAGLWRRWVSWTVSSAIAAVLSCSS